MRIFLLKLGIHAQAEIGGIADLERGGRLEKRARQEEAEEGDEPRGHEGRERSPGKAPAPLIDLVVFRSDGGHARRRRSSGCSDRGRADVGVRTLRHEQRWLQPREDRRRGERAAAAGRGHGSRNRSGCRCFCGAGSPSRAATSASVSGRQALAATARLFGGDGGLAPLLSFRHPLGNFRADGTAGSFCRRRCRGRRRSGGCRRRRARLNRFTQQGRHLRIIQRRQALAATARLLGGDGGLAPLVSLSDPFGDFFADGSCRCGRRCGWRSRCGQVLQPVRACCTGGGCRGRAATLPRHRLTGLERLDVGVGQQRQSLALTIGLLHADHGVVECRSRQGR